MHSLPNLYARPYLLEKSAYSDTQTVGPRDSVGAVKAGSSAPWGSPCVRHAKLCSSCWCMLVRLHLSWGAGGGGGAGLEGQGPTGDGGIAHTHKAGQVLAADLPLVSRRGTEFQ